MHGVQPVRGGQVPGAVALRAPLRATLRATGAQRGEVVLRGYLAIGGLAGRLARVEGVVRVVGRDVESVRGHTGGRGLWALGPLGGVGGVGAGGGA